MGHTRGGFRLHSRAPNATVRERVLALLVIRVSERLFSSSRSHGMGRFGIWPTILFCFDCPCLEKSRAGECGTPRVGRGICAKCAVSTFNPDQHISMDFSRCLAIRDQRTKLLILGSSSRTLLKRRKYTYQVAGGNSSHVYRILEYRTTLPVTGSRRFIRLLVVVWGLSKVVNHSPSCRIGFLWLGSGQGWVVFQLSGHDALRRLSCRLFGTPAGVSPVSKS
jgi:hypothetical protein